MLSESGHTFNLGIPSLPFSQTVLDHQPTMSSQAGWNSVTGIATMLLDGNWIAITIAVLFTFGVPVLLHVIFFRSVASPPSSNFLLLGPSGAGKTALTVLVCSSWTHFAEVLTDSFCSLRPNLHQLPKSHTSLTLHRHQHWCLSVFPQTSLQLLIATDRSMTLH